MAGLLLSRDYDTTLVAGHAMTVEPGTLLPIVPAWMRFCLSCWVLT